MNRLSRRDADRRGKRRTKPPVVNVKPHLPGDRECAARQVFLDAATSGRSVNYPGIVDANPCSRKLHPEWEGWDR